jgi:hypothetical protein
MIYPCTHPDESYLKKRSFGILVIAVAINSFSLEILKSP